MDKRMADEKAADQLAEKFLKVVLDQLELTQIEDKTLESFEEYEKEDKEVLIADTLGCLVIKANGEEHEPDAIILEKNLIRMIFHQKTMKVIKNGENVTFHAFGHFRKI